MSSYVDMEILDAPLVRDRSGDLVPAFDDPRPIHHWKCDGSGRTKTADPNDSVPVACTVCRPHLLVRPQSRGQRPVVSIDRGYRPLD